METGAGVEAMRTNDGGRDGHGEGERAEAVTASAYVHTKPDTTTARVARAD